MNTLTDKGARGAAKKGRAFEGVQKVILEQIKEGVLEVGDKLPPERELAATLGVARQAVREALRSLEMSGVLRFELGVNGGAFVRETGSDGIAFSINNMLILGRLPLSDLLEVRSSLFGEAAKLGTSRASAEQFDELEAKIDLLEKKYLSAVPHATDGPALETYRILARMTHNPLMILLIDAIVDIVAEMVAGLTFQLKRDNVDARREMLAAMRAGQADEAARIIRAHTEMTNSWLLRPDASENVNNCINC